MWTGTLMLAWIAHALYTAASFYPAWELLVPSSVLLGALSAPMWTSQGLYITACGYSFAKTAVSSPYDVFSSFNGIFFTIYETSQIIGEPGRCFIRCCSRCILIRCCSR